MNKPNPPGFRRRLLCGVLLTSSLTFVSGAQSAVSPEASYEYSLPGLNKEIANSPFNTEAYRQRAFGAMAANKLDAALADFSKLVEIDPVNARWYCYRAEILRRQGATEKALQDVQEALRIDPESSEAHCARAHIYYYKGDFPSAANEYSRAISLAAEESKDVTFLYYNRGRAYLEQGEFAKAVADFSVIEPLACRYKLVDDVLIYRGKAYEELGMPSRARRDYYLFSGPIEPNTIGPGGYGWYPPPWIKLQASGDQEAQNQQQRELATSKTMSLCSKVHEHNIQKASEQSNASDPASARPILDGAVSYMLLKHDYNAAIAHCDRIVSPFPRCIPALNCRGYALLELNKPDDALKNFTLVLSIDGSNFPAQNGKGKSLYRKGNYKEAARAFEDAESEGLSTTERRAIIFNQGQAYLANKDYRSAIDRFTTCIKLNRVLRDYRFSEPYYYRGIALHKDGQKPKALANFDVAKSEPFAMNSALPPLDAFSLPLMLKLDDDLKQKATAFAELLEKEIPSDDRVQYTDQ